MGNRTRRNLKLIVPKNLARDDLMRFAGKTVEHVLKTKKYMIVSVTPSHSEPEEEHEMTYKIEVVNLMPN
jgi:hypothetical protein